MSVLKRLLLFLACFAPMMLFAQVVGKVVFDQGTGYQFSEDILRFNVQTRKGRPYSERMVNDDVRRLFALGMFSDIVSSVRDLPDGKKEVKFMLSARPVVMDIAIQGNRKYKTDKLMEHVTLLKNVPLNDTQLSESVRALRDFYFSEGLNDAKIEFKLETVNGGVKVVFHVVENLRVRIDKVTFENGTVYSDSEMKGIMETRYNPLSVSWLSWLPILQGVGLYSKEAIDRDKVRLRDLYWQKGYLDFKVVKVEFTEHKDDPELADVKFVLEEGDPYFVNSIKVIGNKRFAENELLPLVSQKIETPFSSIRENEDLERFEQKYSPLGYADFQARVIRKPDYVTHSVDLEYVLSEGIPYTIDNVFISGNKWTKDHVIRRELMIAPGDPVDKEMIKISKNRLLGMGYFEEEDYQGKGGVEIITSNAEEPGKKNVYIDVRERRFISAKVGAGWSDSDGLAGMLELSHNNMDILDPGNWFTGGGQRFRLAALVGIDRVDAQADFTEPWLFGIPLRFDYSSYWREVAYDDWNERRLGFKLSLAHRVFDDFTTLSGGYIFEYVTVRNMRSKMSPVFQSAVGSELSGKLFLTLERDTRDSFTNPTSGYNVGFHTYLASQAFGGAKNYYKFELKGINYYPFLHNWFVLATGFKVGMMGGINGDSVPLYDRYFLGGGDSLRGFPYRSIGPTDNFEKNYGGEFMYLITAELSHPIWRMVRGAIFVDIGDATEDWGRFNKPNIGLGYGLRIKLPQVDMPLRLDLAYPVLCNQEGVSRKLRFHFNLGVSLNP